MAIHISLVYKPHNRCTDTTTAYLNKTAIVDQLMTNILDRSQETTAKSGKTVLNWWAPIFPLLNYNNDIIVGRIIII